MIYDDAQEKPQSECTHDCSSCSANCSSREKTSLLEKPHEMSNVKKVIGIVSGKGGVGKSIVTSMLSVIMSRRGHSTAILDADITGPSIPKAFGVKGEVTGDGAGGIFPLESKTGIKMMSVNLLLPEETTPVVWRGPVIAGTVKQFWTDVIWDDVDFMFVDMPPGTGDVPLTVFQSIPLDGIIIVTSPQELVSMIVAKAANMAQMMNIPVLGLVENMAYFKCPDCGKDHNIYGESHISEVAEKFGYDVLARMPIDPRLAALCDKGMLELMENDYLDKAAEKLEKLL
ncbi:MAG: Mrp/NBP35 family ATP-binding protein [Clostridia bacterium]|nr:Mrp/NBP35 family ATP-binding protein [Clostridia bacterium]